MKVKLINTSDNWQDIKNATMTTIHKESGKMPDNKWKKKLLIAEHSPIRKLKISWRWEELISWVSVHFVRHKIGIEHWIRTQRTDRTGIDRNDLSQGNLIEHECEANAQAIINISRKRLCMQASHETREAWKAFLETIKDKEPELYNCCVKECVYRGFCPEFHTCGYSTSNDYKRRVEEYRSGIRN